MWPNCKQSSNSLHLLPFIRTHLLPIVSAGSFRYVKSNPSTNLTFWEQVLAGSRISGKVN